MLMKNAVGNEPVKDYAPGSPERAALVSTLAELASRREEFPLIIAGERVSGAQFVDLTPPHEHKKLLAKVHIAEAEETRRAIESCLAAAPDWSRWPWQERAAVFLKAADLLSTSWRARMNAATMLGQSKTVYQAEIDAAAELCDFLRFNVAYLERIQAEQPLSVAGSSNRLDYRPLEGFVYAIGPFNFTSISCNLAAAPALLGNVALWKPATTSAYACVVFMELLAKAGLPDGVINLVFGPGPEISDVALRHPRLAGINFTGSTATFNGLWSRVAENLPAYDSYPRLVGETGGKNFIVAHPSADPDALATAILRGAFEYQGQKCSAASRLFIAQSLWPDLKARLTAEMAAIKTGDVADLSNFMGAVIDRRAFDRFSALMAEARGSSEINILAGGKASDAVGYFVEPTLVETADPKSRFLSDEFFLPLATATTFKDGDFATTLSEIDSSGAYGLTGAIFSRDRAALRLADRVLRNAAGNYYINDKPTGAVVGQQPFGGGRRSGTNDKAGSIWNLIRWLSPRNIKENFISPTHWRYAHMDPPTGLSRQ